MIKVDPQDLYLLAKYSWKLHKKDRRPYRCIQGHRVWFIYWDILGKPPKGYFVDHINGDPSDNRRSNLRVVTPRQNMFNRRSKCKKKASRFKGVHRMKGRTQFYAQIRLNGKSTFLGSFQTEEDAARAYDAAAKKYFGEFACLNFQEEV